MHPPKNLGPRAFLKKLGFQFHKKPTALDRAFLMSLPVEVRDEVEDIWVRLHSGFAHISELYSVPQNEKQASLLFSHDASRAISTMSWFANVVENQKPQDVLEVGCGAGYLLRFLRNRFPETKFSGIDRQENLLAIAAVDTALNLHASSYEQATTKKCYDLIICDFGWDNQDIPESQKPHSSADIAGALYCPGCSDDQIPFFSTLLDQFSRFLNEYGQIAIVGRFPHIGSIRALYLAAEKCELHVERGGFHVIRVMNSEGTERFPAFLITKKNSKSGSLQLEDVAALYHRDPFSS